VGDENLRQKTIKGIGWSILSRFGVQTVQFVLGVVLARLLLPEDFGLIGMIVVFVGFAQIFVDMGFGAALIQKQDTEPTHYYSVFWLNAGIGLLLMIFFMSMAPIIANFYAEPVLIPLTLLLSTKFLIGALGMVHEARLKKAMGFRKLAAVELGAVLVSGVIGVGLAYMDYGVWSLAWQTIANTGLTVALLWIVTLWRPKFQVEIQSIKDLIGFSGNLLSFSIINYWFRSADDLLIGRVVGSTALGLYGKAYSVMLFPVRGIASTIGRVLFPALSSIQDDQERVARVYLRVSRSIALVVFPMMLGLFVVAEHFVVGLFGPQWRDMIPFLRLFCMLGMTQSILRLNGNLYQSQGRTDLQLRVGGLIAVFGIGAIVAGLPWGAIGVAVTYSSYSILTTYPSVRIAVSVVGLTFRDVASNLSGVLGCSLLMGGGVWITSQILPTKWTYLSCLSIEIFVGSILYIAIAHVSGLRAYDEFRDLIMEELARAWS